MVPPAVRAPDWGIVSVTGKLVDPPPAGAPDPPCGAWATEPDSGLPSVCSSVIKACVLICCGRLAVGAPCAPAVPAVDAPPKGAALGTGATRAPVLATDWPVEAAFWAAEAEETGAIAMTIV